MEEEKHKIQESEDSKHKIQESEDSKHKIQESEDSKHKIQESEDSRHKMQENEGLKNNYAVYNSTIGLNSDDERIDKNEWVKRKNLKSQGF